LHFLANFWGRRSVARFRTNLAAFDTSKEIQAASAPSYRLRTERIIVRSTLSSSLMLQLNAGVAAPVQTARRIGRRAPARVRISNPEHPRYRELQASDRLLAGDQEPPMGAHVVTLRRGFTHHGIYVGRGAVVQYGGLARGLRKAPVEEVLLTEFADGYPVWVRSEGSRRFDGDAVVSRARSRLGEDRYSVLKNNCEHFCEWCIRGEPHSYQVNEWLSRPWRALKLTIGLLLRPDVRGLRGAHFV
jgi:hypothetical protein